MGVWYYNTTGRFGKGNHPVQHALPSSSAKQSVLGNAQAAPSSIEWTELCGNCHQHVVERWQTSHHANAMRTVPRDHDRSPGLSKAPVAVIGVTPIEQVIVETARGNYQVYNPAYDVQKREWFSIFGDAEPQASDWGHWTQRGMNWNAQCAVCHVTGFEKGYAPETDSYATKWLTLGVSCAECHPRWAEHLTEPSRALREQKHERSSLVAACAACHSRREDLTGSFQVGERFEDHFRLLLADNPDLYYPDSRARDEVFEYGSLALSRMGSKGIDCLDCHDPHNGGLRLEGNSTSRNTLCLNCHGTKSQKGAPAINPTEHSHHAEGSKGAQCIECHMPEETYLQRDRRRDHSFCIPDPILAAELGWQDACTECHKTDRKETIEAAYRSWYSISPETHRRKRARLYTRAYNRDPNVASELVHLAREESNSAHRASLVGLLIPFAYQKDVYTFLIDCLEDSSELVQVAAIRGLARLTQAKEFISAKTSHKSRLVRLTALWATRSKVTRDSPQFSEVMQWLRYNADQPAGAVRMAEWSISHNEYDTAVQWAQKAVMWDPSPPSKLTLQRALRLAQSRSGQ